MAAQTPDDGVPPAALVDVDGSKPDPDLVEVGRERAGGGPAVMIGDSTWDCVAARRAGVPTVALTTGLLA